MNHLPLQLQIYFITNTSTRSTCRKVPYHFLWRQNYMLIWCISPETSIDHLKYTCTYHHTVKPDIWATMRFIFVKISQLLFIKTCWSLTQSRFWVLVRTSVQASQWGRGRGKHTWPSASILRLRRGVMKKILRNKNLQSFKYPINF